MHIAMPWLVKGPLLDEFNHINIKWFSLIHSSLLALEYYFFVVASSSSSSEKRTCLNYSNFLTFLIWKYQWQDSGLEHFRAVGD